MELRQLEYLVAVVDEGGFTRAAERLHVAQPGVSAQIRGLERELGARLLDRSGRQVRATQVGEVVLAHARAVLAGIERVRGAVDEFTGLVRGHVTVGTVSSSPVGGIELPELLARFQRDHPGVQITMAEGTADLLITQLRSGDVDIGFVPLGDSTPDGLDVQDVLVDRLVVAVAPDHELAGRESVELGALRDRVLIGLPHGSGLRRILEDECARVGFAPAVRYEASNPPLLARLAASGLGVAVVPESAVRDDPTVRVAQLRPRIRGRIALAWRTDGPTSPAAAALLARARALAESSAV